MTVNTSVENDTSGGCGDHAKPNDAESDVMQETQFNFILEKEALQKRY